MDRMQDCGSCDPGSIPGRITRYMKNDFLVIGMSPGNGYFKQEVINKLVRFSVENYKDVSIFIPDIPAISTYIALGYPESIARKEKAIPQGKGLRNKTLRAIEDLGEQAKSVRFFDWENEVETNEEYISQLKYLNNLYEINEDFKKDINEASEEVLFGNPFRKTEINPEQIRIATNYILSEFAFLMFIPSTLNGNCYAYGYHRPWLVFEKFIAGEYDGEKKAGIEFKLLPDFSQKD